jgi:hypothetical protein
MKRREMTEKQRYWLEIGEAYETPPEHRTGDQRELTYSGLCFACSVRSDNRQGAYCIIDNFRRSCGYVDGLSYNCWPRRQTTEGDSFRATMAFLFAAMSNKDRNEVVEGL